MMMKKKQLWAENNGCYSSFIRTGWYICIGRRTKNVFLWYKIFFSVEKTVSWAVKCLLVFFEYDIQTVHPIAFKVLFKEPSLFSCFLWALSLMDTWNVPSVMSGFINSSEKWFLAAPPFDHFHFKYAAFLFKNKVRRLRLTPELWLCSGQWVCGQGSF